MVHTIDGIHCLLLATMTEKEQTDDIACLDVHFLVYSFERRVEIDAFNHKADEVSHTEIERLPYLLFGF